MAWFVVEFGTTNYRSIGTRPNYGTGEIEGPGTTVSTTNGSRLVTGAGTTWLSSNRGRGDAITIATVPYTISRVLSNTQLLLTSDYLGAIAGGLTYSIERHFATLQAWEDCISPATSSLVADARSEVGVTYADTPFGAALTIAGATTDATHTITLTAAERNRHYGIADGGAGTSVVVNPAGTAIVIQDDHVTIECLEIAPSAGNGISVSSVAASNKIVIQNNLVHDNPGDGIHMADTSVDVDIYNNIVYDVDRGINLALAVTQADIFNNTVYNCSVNGIDGAAGQGPWGAVTLRNNISHSSTFDDFDLDSPPTVNAASDNTATSVCCTGHSPGGGGQPNILLAAMNFVSTTPSSEDLHITAGSAAADQGVDLSASFTIDIDNGARSVAWDIGADDIVATTAVELLSFTATGSDASELLEWETGSELDNLGFHLYRSMAEEGPYERLTASLIPGLGSSPAGARYRYRDTGVTNGVSYFYKLEDIETTGKTSLHGPVSATADASAASHGGDSGSGASDASSGDGASETVTAARIIYGEPSSSSLRVLKRGKRQLVLELLTGGFYATPQEDGTVRLEIPEFQVLDEQREGAPGLPVKRSWVEALAGQGVELVSVQAQDVEVVTGLIPSEAARPELVASRDGTVCAGLRKRKRSARAEFRKAGLLPSEAARVVSVGFQGEVKKALVELAPLRWDPSSGRLFLARRLRVVVKFHGSAPDERARRKYRDHASHKVRDVVARLATTEKGLHSVSFEDVFSLHPSRAVKARSLRLSRQGKTVAFHLEPNRERFTPGSTLYFVSAGAAGHAAVYELETGAKGKRMATSPAAPRGRATSFYWHRAEEEVDYLYQPALVQAPELWLWDTVFSSTRKSYEFDVSSRAAVSESSRLKVWLQGASDFPETPDHHVRLYVNGSVVEELSWDGKQAVSVEAELAAGVLQEGANHLEIENVGDTEAQYSMVMLDRFRVLYPRRPLAEDGRLGGSWSESGVVAIAGLSPGAHLVDVTKALPRWLTGTKSDAGGSVRFRARAGRSYLATSPEALRQPVVRAATPVLWKRSHHQADYVVIGPRAFLQAATELVEHRRGEGLTVAAVPVEDIYAEFGFGEPTPESIGEFISYAYHRWRSPSPRYVVLVGDATYDPKDIYGTGVLNHVPSPIVKTSYLWTSSDPSYARVNGEDVLPDLALGRLPAATVAQVRVLVEKILEYETGDTTLEGPVFLITDNPDFAGDFDADARELASGVLSTRNPQRISLAELGTTATRSAIVQAFDEGSSLVSYMGHGGIHLWANENLLNIWQVDTLAAQSQQPLLLTMNCLNGYFHFPFFDSLSEALVKAEDRGAIAAFSPSGLSLNEPAHRYHEALVRELFEGGHQRLGDAVLAAQSAYADTGGFPELLSIYHLLGDPALNLH